MKETNINPNNFHFSKTKEYKIIQNGIEYEVKNFSNGSKYWFYNDKCHRINGPAVEWANGYKAWYLDNIRYASKKEYYLELLKRKLITKKEAFIELI